MADAGWTAAAFVCVLLALLLCAAYALLAVLYKTGSRRRTMARLDIPEIGKDSESTGVRPTGVDDFITARGSVGMWMLSFSFYAGSMGSWAVTAPGNFACTGGLLGLTSYSLAAGAPIVIVAYAGTVARSADPEACSLPDFLRRRFRGTGASERSSLMPEPEGSWAGSAIAALASCVTLFVMAIAMLAEYASLGSLFRSYVGVGGALACLPTLILAGLTMSYTVAGGLYVSILTDRVQAIGSIVLVVGIASFLADFHAPPGGLPPMTDVQRGTTLIGYSSLLTMPLSLLACTLFSESVWQRVWASEDDAALQRASWIGAVAVSLTVFFFGFVGFLALWSGRADPLTTHPNLYFFAFFSHEPKAELDSIPGLAALVCAALMAEGGVDSLQNGITATISSTLLKGRSLWATRLVVLLVNVPLAILGATPVVQSVLSLFLLSNMLTVSCTIPLVLALLPGADVRRCVSEASVIVGCFCGMLGVSLYGISCEGALRKGIYKAWLGNEYAYDYFLVALLASLAGASGAAVVNCICRQLRGGKAK